MDVSIVIVSYNTADLLCACLKSIGINVKCDHEVIVVDNNSADDSVERVRREFPSTIVIQNPDNSGFAAANNIGFDVAKGRYILMLNPDTEVVGSAVDALVDYGDRHLDVGCVAARNVNPDMTLQRSCHHFPTIQGRLFEYLQLRVLFPDVEYFGRSNMTYWDYNDTREVDWATGACLLIRRVTLDDVGYLDDRFFMYAEEVDWCLRARKKGWPLVFLHDAAIIHHYGASAAKSTEHIVSRNVSRFLFQSEYLYFEKHYGRAVELLVRMLDCVYACALWGKQLIRRDSEVKRNRIATARQILRLALSRQP